jgi:hypothetical protein
MALNPNPSSTDRVRVALYLYRNNKVQSAIEKCNDPKKLLRLLRIQRQVLEVIFKTLNNNVI